MDTNLIGKIFDMPTRIPAETIEKAKMMDVATISASMPEPRGRESLIRTKRLMRVSGTGVIAGSAVTAWNPPGNNSMVRFAIEACEPGDVIVMTTPSDNAAQWGEIASNWARARGAAGVIIDGAVRDIALVREQGLSVWGRCIDPSQALKDTLGFVNAPVVISGVQVRPGDLVVADDDAVLVLPREQAAGLVDGALARFQREEKARSEVATGQRSSYLAAIFNEEAIKYVEQPWTA